MIKNVNFGGTVRTFQRFVSLRNAGGKDQGLSKCILLAKISDSIRANSRRRRVFECHFSFRIQIFPYPDKDIAGRADFDSRSLRHFWVVEKMPSIMRRQIIHPGFHRR